jgi:hemerythrin superfamily protein
MSFLDKIADTVMPAASDEDRAKARREAQSLAREGDWFSLVIDHHRQIESAFADAFAAGDAAGRTGAMKRLGLILTGHSDAEETVLYPALAEIERARTAMAFEEQAMAKIQMAKLEKIDPMSSDWKEKLAHIQSAVEQHVYQEESSWFPKLQEKTPESERTRLTARFREEYERYAGHDAGMRASAGVQG